MSRKRHRWESEDIVKGNVPLSVEKSRGKKI